MVPRPRRDSAELGLTRLPPTSAALALLAFPRILGVSDPGLLAAQFVLVTELAEAVPVLVADVPWGPPFRAGLGAELLAALETELDEAPSASARTDHHAGTRS